MVVPAPEHITYRTKLTQLHDLGSRDDRLPTALVQGRTVSFREEPSTLLQFHISAAVPDSIRHGSTQDMAVPVFFSAPERMVRSTAHITTSRALIHVSKEGANLDVSERLACNLQHPFDLPGYVQIQGHCWIPLPTVKPRMWKTACWNCWNRWNHCDKPKQS